MIPISADPKRFVSALTQTRLFSRILARSHARPSPFFPLPRYQSSIVDGKATGSTVLTSKLQLVNALSTAPAHLQKIDLVVKPRTNVNRNEVAPYPLNSSPAALELHGPRSKEWWTGKAPIAGVCPGVEADGKIYSLPQLTFTKGNITKEALQAYFDNTWTLTEVLFASLQGEETFMRPPYHDLRHPMIFYYGHPAALYINKLRVGGLLKEPINEYFESIFETGVDEMSWDDLSKNKMPWPSVASVHKYRQKVYSTVSNVIANLTQEELNSINQSSPLWSLVMSFEHERIHLETSSFLINELPVDLLRFPEGFPSYHPLARQVDEVLSPVQGQHFPTNEMIQIPAQTVTIGKSREFPSFGWDNEYGHRAFSIPTCRVSKFKVTNGEFLAFVKDGGYARNELWSENGWKWRAYRNVKWPYMWQRKGPQGKHEYELRQLFDITPMVWDLPVVVNFHEATAFAKWKSLQTGTKMRLLTEPEHHAIRGQETAAANEVAMDHAVVSGGHANMTQGSYNTNLAYSSMSPVTACHPNTLGFHDVFGNAWEWTEDYFAALPGFEVHPYYEDFSTPCFDGQHHVIQGGSFISTGNEASIHARYHFRPHFYQHASFRLVEQLDSERSMITSDTDAPGPFVGNYPFRRSEAKLLSQMMAVSHSGNNNQHEDNVQVLLSKHFGSVASLPFDWSLRQFHDLIAKAYRAPYGTPEGTPEGNHSLTEAKVLEVGCGVGGLVFAFAEQAHTVIGVDHNQEAVNIARKILSGRKGTFTLPAQGETVVETSFELPQTFTAEQIEFRCADPMCLPAEMKGFDIVIINDILDKVSSPNAVLGRLGGVRGLVRSGGVLAVISSYQWNADRTPKSLWLGDGKQRGEDVLVQRLAEDFEVVEQKKVPVYWQESEAIIKGKVNSFTLFVRK